MKKRMRFACILAGLTAAVTTTVSNAASAPATTRVAWNWMDATPESQGMSSAELESLWLELSGHNTKTFLVIRNDRIVFERYAPGFDRTKPHSTASLAKALVGGMSLMVAMNDGRVRPDDPASRYVPQWANDPVKSKITIRHLATHTSGIEDAEADGLPHEKLPGWKGDFWKRLPPPQDPFSLARDAAPVLEPPGSRARYSNPGMAMLAYCITTSLRGTADPDLRSLLEHRLMNAIDVPAKEWSVGYGQTTRIDGLNLVATWGGGSYSANAAARVGRLMLRKGNWNGRQLIAPGVVEAVAKHAGLPSESGLGWWVNGRDDGSRVWTSAPTDAFWGAGAGHQFLLVVPSLNLIVVRNGDLLQKADDFNEGLEKFIVTPLMKACSAVAAAPYPPSPVIRHIDWAPKESIIRLARDSDNWPLTWGDDDCLYTAWGDGTGFSPKTPKKLSLGLAKVLGSPPEITGINVRSATIEQSGDGEAGKKASGILMVDGVLYLWARNAANSQLAWSADHGATWAWADWKFTTSFGCPTFLNFGRNYAGARDRFVYIYSPNTDSAYTPADRMVLARVPVDRMKRREAYEFFSGLNREGTPIWGTDINQRGAVFVHRGNCWRGGITYNAALKRYLWCQVLPASDHPQGPRFQGGFGIYDAAEPWGPWTTAYYTQAWDVGPGETSSFPTKWMSGDGKTLHLVFSGNDAFTVRRCVLVMEPAVP
jgi:CubicO group peptidase (beta-lactamase class C family)